MTSSAGRIRQVERRLEQLLASGRPNSLADTAILRDEASAIEDVGLTELAERLRRVATLDDQYVPALGLALTSCRLLRARLPDDAPPAGNWEPLVAARGRRQGGERLVPIGRVTLAEGEAWACARLHYYDLREWLLVAPPPDPPPRDPGDDEIAPRLTQLRLTDLPTHGPGRADDGIAPWLTRPLHALLRWEARLPLGARGDVQMATVVECRWAELPDIREDPFAALRQVLAAGDLLGGKSAYVEHGRLRVISLDAEDAASCVWPDLAMAWAFQDAATSPVWAIAWVDGALVAPLAIVEPGDGTRPARVVHLVHGNPSDKLIG
jgi:hypothetical protein